MVKKRFKGLTKKQISELMKKVRKGKDKKMDYKNMIPMGVVLEKFLKLEKIDNVKDISELLTVLKYDKEVKDKFDKFLKNIDENLKK